ncbi:MAG: methylmalonyl-CoA mutase [Nevskiaceae bacterium]|nr:MAG: methylmalonyl-CoA mutase [Nevskiaceae bacterium]TBR74794.1 MAG: methylmalonyl-CoA mutase [Nevskiaceae bacterium]
MNDPKIAKPAIEATHKLRFVTATSLFDGHDVSVNIMRRILQSMGAEVIHLGHNRSVQEIVAAALQEDAQGVAITSYQGGHIEFFKYLVDLLREQGGADIKVFGGGGGTIIPAEIRELMDYGVARIYSPEDGAKMGLPGMIADVVALADRDPCANAPKASEVLALLKSGDRRALARVITALEAGHYPDRLRKELREAAADIKTPVLGITGTGGAGKSSLTDELILRLRLDYDDALKIGDISIDPSRKRTGGALLGDRIRMNSIDTPQVYFRSLATRDTASELSKALPEVIAACKLSGFDLLLVETSGIGQGDAAIVPFVDLSMYVMTPEFGAASQLEKIDMLDFADFIAINKFDRKGAEDALRDVAKQYQRNRELFGKRPDEMPVFGTVASHFHDDGVTALYQALRDDLVARGLPESAGRIEHVVGKASSLRRAVVPPERARYLAEIAETVRGYHHTVAQQARTARELQSIRTTQTLLTKAGKPAADLTVLETAKADELQPAARKLLATWPELRERYAQTEYVVKVRDREVRTQLATESLSGTRIPKVALPKFEDDGETLRFLMKENLPGAFPFTGGVFPFKRDGEDPTRMFAGEGDAARTNRRFKKLSEGMQAKRLSTAFDSVTLYGWDPAERPDIYGKVGNSGVSICTLDDMKVLYGGFDLCAPNTSVSMTINGPAPTILAMFMNTAIDQQLDKFKAENGRAANAEEAAKIRAHALSVVRGTVQADILKEDQGQNTCIFSTEFSLRAMGDIQEYFVQHSVRNFYSVSISGYHIAEAGANPISQLAFTLANGFTFVEAYLARGMKIDDFAPNLSFFFSNGMDPEYSVIGRVARRIWAVAMRDKYGANERSQKLKYHVQTSGRSLHAQEMAFNDIRTTLEALIAIYDNCNSLHTNAYDEAVTTPTEESVRRALAIQLVINHEWGLAKNQNPLQGSFIIDELTDLVEAAVLKEFDAISSRGGVLGAMETAYQRGKIQEESMLYEQKKNDGSLPIMGVNTFRNPKGDDIPEKMELARSTDAEKQSQLKRLAEFQARNADAAPAMKERIRQVALSGDNVFEMLMDAVRVLSLGEITQTLFQVGGRYRRNM